MEHNPDRTEIDSFLKELKLPIISKEQADALETPLTPDELYKALHKMPNNKSPGPDGLPAEFYKYLLANSFSIISQSSH